MIYHHRFVVAPRPSSSDVLAIGRAENVNLIDLAKTDESIINTNIKQCENDAIVNMTFSENSAESRCVIKNR